VTAPITKSVTSSERVWHDVSAPLYFAQSRKLLRAFTNPRPNSAALAGGGGAPTGTRAERQRRAQQRQLCAGPRAESRRSSMALWRDAAEEVGAAVGGAWLAAGWEGMQEKC